jgi:CRISPR-associated protein Cmr6
MKKNSDRIPLMFRAQVEGRCQIQRLPTAKKQAEQWTEEWIEGVDENIPKFSKNVQTREYQITWRFITNSGQDETVTRPVIGAKGFPWYPGSSMKGAFLRACPPEDKIRYCGGQQGNETKPGILRFHGGYPQDLNWIKRDLVDVVHPQQEWQTQTINTKNKPKGESAFVQISLYQPHLVFGISSPENLSEEEWEKIWNIWEQALAQGIGSRVSAGYGQAKL